MRDSVEIPGAKHVNSGKVRELYQMANGNLLMIATDRISAYDFVLDTPIPDKGRILTRMSQWWFPQLTRLVDNHTLADELPPEVPPELRERTQLCEPLEMYPVECVARGYLTGSGLVDYGRTGQVCGVELPPGLQDGSRLPEPIFTPATKAQLGEHDENVSYDAVAAVVGAETASTLRALTLEIYRYAEGVARERGIILADTKFEFGRRADGSVVLADEVVTPDSSRFWPLDEWEPGRAQTAYDKQFVRDWLTSEASGWDRASGKPPPPLPEEVVRKTRERYVEAYERLTGEQFT